MLRSATDRRPAVDTASTGVGWLFAIADKQMSAALCCMHDDPKFPSTIQAPAERVGMSRSIFCPAI